jgi:hypothetical protein
VRQCDSATVRQYDSTTVRQYDSTTVRQCDGTTVRRCDNAIVRDVEMSRCRSVEMSKCHEISNVFLKAKQFQCDMYWDNNRKVLHELWNNRPYLPKNQHLLLALTGRRRHITQLMD